MLALRVVDTMQEAVLRDWQRIATPTTFVLIRHVLSTCPARGWPGNHLI
jgi:hypothetical protein